MASVLTECGSVLFKSAKTIVASTSIRKILSQPKPKGIVFLDLDDTVGRVSQALGLDAWFRFRIAQFSQEGHEPSRALELAISLYNQAQLASTKYVPVEVEVLIAEEIEQLKEKNIDVIGLTARNHTIALKTHELLETLGVTFSATALKDGEFEISGYKVIASKGVIFANGRHKGECIEVAAQNKLFIKGFHTYSNFSFVDDSQRNCKAVAETAQKLKLDHRWSIFHYKYAEQYLPFCENQQAIAAIQEEKLLANGELIDNVTAESHLSLGVEP